MPNILNEYRKRHNIKAIPANHDGLCFFNDGSGKPALIAMTSLNCRSFTTCPKCEDKNHNIIIEYFIPNVYGGFLQKLHTHVDLSVDLYKHAQESNSSDLTPFQPKENRDLEAWLFRFCFHKPLRGYVQNEDNPLEEIFWTAVHQPTSFSRFYVAYETFLLSRKYLIYR